jgi:hypothetical protein
MKKYIRGTFGRLLSMTLMVLFLLPSLIAPLATRGNAAVGGRINILFMPLELANPDAPPNLSTRILQEMQIALAQREGVQVTELLQNSPIMRRALEAVGENNKQALLDKYRDAADPKMTLDSRKNAAGELVRVLGVDAIVYGTINNYEFTTKPDKNRTYIKVTASKVTLAEDGTAVLTPLEAVGSSWVRPDGKGEQATHDLEAIQAVAQNLAGQLTGRAGAKPPPEKSSWINIFGGGTSQRTSSPSAEGKPPSKSWVWLSVLGLAAVALIAGGGGDDGGGGGGTPPPVSGIGYAYPENNGYIRLEIAKPDNWDDVLSFQVWRDAMGEARGRTTTRTRTSSTRAFSLVSATERDQAIVQGNKVILYDNNAAYGYVYAYRVVVVIADRASTNVTMYNGQAPLMQLTAVGPYVPPPVERVISPSHTGGRVTLYWYMPGEGISQPPSASYIMPTYVSGFVVQMQDESGTWITIASGIGKNVRQYLAPIPQPNTDIRYTVRAVSSQAGLMFPLEALSPAQYNQVVVVVNSDTAYSPAAPSSLSVNAVISGSNPDKINMQLNWPMSTDPQVTGYKIYRRTTVAAPSSRTRIPTSRNQFSARRALIGDQQEMQIISGRTSTTWTDTTLSAADYETSFIYSVTSIAVGGAESTQTDGQVAIAPVAPPAPGLTVVPNPDNPQLSAFQLYWGLPANPTIYGYVIYRAENSLLSSRGPSGIVKDKLPRVMDGRGTRGRSGTGDLRGRATRVLTNELSRTSQRSKITYTDKNLVNGVTYTYAISYLYLGGIEGNQSPEVSREYNVLPGDVTNLTLTEPDPSTRHLSWTAPTTNVDGSPLIDGQAFRIYRSTTLTRLPGPNPTVDRATLQASFTLLAATPNWTTTEYSDTTAVPLRQNVSYVVVSLDNVNQESPGPYEVVQLVKLPDALNGVIMPSPVTATVGDPPLPMTATIYGVDGQPLPYTSITLTVTPANAGTLSLLAAGPFTQQITVITDETGSAAFFWRPPTNVANAADFGTITAVITGTGIEFYASLVILRPLPPGYNYVRSISLAIAPGERTRIYFSQDVDDRLSEATVNSSVLQATGRDATGAVTPFARIMLTTDRGGFEKMAVDQVVSPDRRSIIGVLDDNGQMYCRFTGRMDNGVTDPYIRLPLDSELGTAIIRGQDTYEAITFAVTGTFPVLVGPPYRLNVVQGATLPATPPGWPVQNDQLPVIFQNQTTTIEATATDRIGQRVLQGMPIWFTHSWTPFNPALTPYDYNGPVGHANIAGSGGGPVALTDSNGVANAGFSSNHSGIYTVRAYALLKQYNEALLNSYNLNATGGLQVPIATGDPLLNNLLWNSAEGPATPERLITENLSILNKTYAYYDHWTVLEVSDGVNSSTTFAQFPNERPPIVINCDGTQTARITFTATDEDSKKVLPRVPFKVTSRLGQTFIEMEGGLLQLDGDLPNVNRAGTIMSLNDRSEAYVLSRGDQVAPMIGTIRLRFDNMRSVQPQYTYPGYLLGHRGPSIWLVTPTSVHVGSIMRPQLSAPVRLASADGRGNVPKSVEAVAMLRDMDGNPYPGNYWMEINGIGMGSLTQLDLQGQATVTLNAPDLDEYNTMGFDEINNILPRPFLTDVIDTGPTVFSDPFRNTRVIMYGNPWEQPREDWPWQYVTVERPHRLTNMLAPGSGPLPFGVTNIDLWVRVWNNLLEKSTVYTGWEIKWKIEKSNINGNSTMTPDPSITDDNGLATSRFSTGTVWDEVRIVAFYDTNGDGLYAEGAEPGIRSNVIYIGLRDPTGLVATDIQQTSITLQWDPLPGAAQYELERGGQPLAIVTGTTYTDTGLTPDTPYTYRVRGVSGGITSGWITLTVRTLAPPPPPP